MAQNLSARSNITLMQPFVNSHRQFPNLCQPLYDASIELSILLRVLWVIEPLSTEFLLDFIQP